MSWLDPLLAIKTQQAGTTAGTRQTINFASGATVVDDPANDRVNVTITDTGITQLTGDVTAGPGSGSIAATVAKVNGVSVSGTPSSGQVIRATSGTASAWANVARGDITNTSGAVGDIITGDATTLGRLAIGSTGQVLTVSGGAPVWQQPGWYTAYEIDFTAQTPVASFANGTHSIGGKNWVLNGVGAGVTADLSAANGLRLSGAAGSSVQADWRTDSFDNIVGSNTFNNFSIMIWLRLERSISQSGGTQSNSLTYIGNLRGGVTWYYFGGVEWNSAGSYGAPSGLICYQAAYLGGGTNYFPSGIASFKGNYTQDSLTNDVFCYRMIEHDRLDVWSGAWASGWPSMQSMKYRGYVSRSAQFAGGGASLQQFNLSELFLTMMQINASASTGSVTESRLKALRIQTL